MSPRADTTGLWRLTRHLEQTLQGYGDLHVTQSHLAEKHETNVVRLGGPAVVGAFRDHVRKVDPFTEHVASDRGLWRCYTKTLCAGGKGQHKYSEFQTPTFKQVSIF